MRMEVNDEELKKLEKLEKQEGNRNWMTINLKENERLDELQRNGYQIIQNPEKFCFGMDAVLYHDPALQKAKKGDKTLDLGTGTGIIPILMEAKNESSTI